MATVELPGSSRSRSVRTGRHDDVVNAKDFDAITPCLQEGLRAYFVRGVGPTWAATTSQGLAFQRRPDTPSFWRKRIMLKTSLLFSAGMALVAAPATFADVITIGSDGVVGPATGITVQTWIRSDNSAGDSDDNFNFVGSLAGGADLRGLVGFDLSDPLLDGATINSVTVSLFQSASTTGGPGTSATYDINLTGLTGAVSNAATWDATSGFFDATLSTTTGDPTSVTQNTEFAFGSTSDLVNYVQASLGGDEVQFGIQAPGLEALTERSFFAFGEPNAGEGTAFASIEIDFTPVPEPGSLALLGPGWPAASPASPRISLFLLRAAVAYRRCGVLWRAIQIARKRGYRHPF